MKVKLYKLTDKGEILISESDYPNTIKEYKESDYLPKPIIELMKHLKEINKLFEPNEPIKEISKAYKKTLKFAEPQQKVLELLNINKSYYKIESPLKKYLGTYTNLYGSIKAFENNPFLKQQKELKKRVNEYLKAYENYKNTTFYKEDLKEKESLKKELEIIKKQFDNFDKLVLEKAYKLLSITANKKQKTKPIKPLTLQPNPIIDLNWTIKILFKETQPLFVSNLEQWNNLFSNDIQIFNTPIELKPNTTLSDLYLFFKYLYDYKLIKKERIFTILEQSKSFSFKGNIVKVKQLTDAKQNYKLKDKTKNDELISNMFYCLKVTD